MNNHSIQKMTKQEKIHYEFGGPIGAFFVVVSLPFVIWGLYLLCNDSVCLNNPLEFDWKAWLNNLPPLTSFVTCEAFYMYFGWMAFHFLLEAILPGEVVEGVVLPDKTRLLYRMSGHLQFWVTFVGLCYGLPAINSYVKANGSQQFLPTFLHTIVQIEGFTYLPLHLLYDHYLPLITMSIIFSTVFSIYL